MLKRANIPIKGGERMPRSKSGTYDNKSYQNEYHKNMKTKLLSFNPNNHQDMQVWNHLMALGRGNAFPYIKRLILEDMKKQGKI